MAVFVKYLFIFLIGSPYLLVGCEFQSKTTSTKFEIIEQLNYKFEYFVNTDVEELANAIRNQDTIMMRKFLDSKPNLIDHQDPKKKNSLLILTVVYNLKSECKILLEYGANPNLLNFYKASAMYYAFSYVYAPDNCDLTIPNLLIKYGGNVNYIDSEDVATLISSSISGKIEPYDCFSRTKLLIDNGADINLWVKDQIYCPVNQALKFDKYKVAELFLIEYKAKIPKFGYKVLNDNGTFRYVTFRDYILELINKANKEDVITLKNILNYIDNVN